MDFTQDGVVELARQLINHDVPNDYTMTEANEAMHKALVAANGGSDKINLRTFHNTECFTIIEKMLPLIEEDTFKEDDLWNSLVESLRVDIGDRNEFWVDDDSLFIISEIGRGNQGIRRQRFGNRTAVTVPVVSHAARVYEHMDRVMSGRIDFSTFIQRVSRSLVQKRYEEIYNVFSSISGTTDGMYSDVFKSGTYDEDTIINIIDHIEADTGATAKIIGSRPALRKLKMTDLADQAKTDMYNMGYYGRFNGTDCLVVRQRNQAGTHDFVFPQDRIYILAGDDKPIKYVEEGDPYMITRDFGENGDLTQEYTIIKRYGVGLLMRKAIGCFTFATA